MTAYNQTNPINYIKGLHRNTDGYITLFRKLSDGAVKQYHYKLDRLNDATLNEWVTYDSYISLNSFYRTKRGNEHLRTIHNLYIDLDTYNTPFTNEQVLAALETDYYDQSIPKPNTVLHSGRGLGLVWNIEPISGLAIAKFDIVQRAIYEQLKQFGADPQALDASRVFRLPASVNSKSNEIVRYDQLHDFEYSIEEVANDFLNVELLQRKLHKANKKPSKQSKPRRKRKVVSYFFNPYTLAKSRLDDLEKLIKMRGGAMPRQRERVLFLTRYFTLKISSNEQKAIEKMRYINGLFDVPLKESELLKATYSAVTYFKGAGIKLKNEKLIEWLAITPAEQQELSTIISTTEKRDRDRIRKQEKRRAANMQTMAQYNAKRLVGVIRLIKRLKLVMITYPNLSIRELAERLGKSKSYVCDLLKRADELLALDAANNVVSIEFCGQRGQVSGDVSSYVKREGVAGVGSTKASILADDFMFQLGRLDMLLSRLLAT